MTETLPIRELAEVRTGYTFRKPRAENSRVGLLGLHISDVRDTQLIEPSCLSSIEWRGKGDPPVLQPGEVVLAAKGDKNCAALFKHRDAQVIPSSHFLILNVRRERQILPEFLCWLLNYELIQQRLAEYKTGTNIPSLSKKALLTVDIPVPSIQTQYSVLRLHTLWHKEVKTMKALLNNREQMLKGVFNDMVNGETHEYPS